MKHDYFKETLPEFCTPKAVAGQIVVDGVKRHVTMWLCTLDDSLDRSKWFFAVQVEHCDVNDITKVFQKEVHFYTDERDAWIYRANALGSDKVHFTDYKRVMDKTGDVIEIGGIQTMDFSDRPLWDGHTYQEIKNLKGSGTN